MSVTAIRETEPTKEREVDGAAPAIQVKTARQVGNQLMEMVFMAPLDMNLKDLNAYVDKVTSVMDRQGDKAALEAEQMALAAAEKNLVTNVTQLADAQSRAQTDWEITNRKGPFKATDSQKKQFENFERTSIHLRTAVIPKHKQNIEELKRKIAGE